MKRGVIADVFYVGAIDWDRRLFDELIPLPDGTSYNSYLVKGSEKTALIDTVDPTKMDVLLENLEELHIEKLDYVVTNHAEQDHSGTLPRVLSKYPEAKVLTTQKCKSLLVSLLCIPENRILTVENEQILSLGNKTLEFIHFPWVHWPETMVTYLKEDRVLFSCDLFGSHYATSDLFVVDEPTIYEAAKRYYAEIMMPFRTVINKNLQKIRDLEISIIAPSHGPIYQKPEFIIEAYNEWISAPPKNIVVLPYISMHGSTKKMIEHFVDALIERGIKVERFDLSRTDIGKLAISLVDAATVVIGSPTVLGGPHPGCIGPTYLVNALRPKIKYASIIGSYGWGTRIIEKLTGMLSSLNLELLEPVVIKGFPSEEDFKALDKLADEILNKHNKLSSSK
ncbi:MAG: FprA family A-type flavoprotein [Candidatus Bathyarchaeota archaeon]|jgi:flavorubredoxin